jgi:opine dehydrogenase
VNVAVLGGSHGAYATAADLTLAGHRVRLWRRNKDDVAPLAAGITLKAEGRQGGAKLDRATADLGEAVAAADVVVVQLQATSHEAIAGRLAPVRAANLPVGVFPASRSKEALARVGELFPATRPCVDAIDVALDNAGPVIHPPLVLVNAGAIDAGRFDIHAAGTTASARRLIDAIDRERIAARHGWGYPAPHYELATYYDESRAAEGLYGTGAKAKLVASGLWSELLTFEHRYVTEDVVLGLPFFESAARSVSTASPTVSGLLGVFGALLGTTLSGRGRDLDHLGLGELTLREVRELFHSGWASPTWRRLMR